MERLRAITKENAGFMIGSNPILLVVRLNNTYITNPIFKKKKGDERQQAFEGRTGRATSGESWHRAMDRYWYHTQGLRTSCHWYVWFVVGVLFVYNDIRTRICASTRQMFRRCQGCSRKEVWPQDINSRQNNNNCLVLLGRGSSLSHKINRLLPRDKYNTARRTCQSTMMRSGWIKYEISFLFQSSIIFCCKYNKLSKQYYMIIATVVLERALATNYVLVSRMPMSPHFGSRMKLQKCGTSLAAATRLGSI